MKQKDHERLTARAIELYGEHFPGEFATRLAERAKEIITGSAEADVAPAFDRVTNWHFYPENPTLRPRLHFHWGFVPLSVTPTSDVILGKRLEELQGHLTWTESNRFGDLVGRVLHHIQDMSTPSHVVPVYHGFSPEDAFETYSKERSDKVIPGIKASASDLLTLNDDTRATVETLYHDAAKATLAYLYDSQDAAFTVTVDDEEREGDWGLFWRRFGDGPVDGEYPPLARFPGFGRFGPLGHDFGDPDITRNGNTYAVPTEAYEKLHDWVLHKQVVDSLRALRALQRMWEAAMAKRDYSDPPPPEPWTVTDD